MPYTINPKQRCAKAFGSNLKISAKSAEKICSVIRGKPLNRVSRLLNDLNSGRRSLRGKYYTKAVAEIKNLLNSCEKNAVSLGLDTERLVVHASAHKGTIMRRRRRKAAFGSRIKSTNLEIILLEKFGKEKEKKKKEVTKREAKERKSEEKEVSKEKKRESKKKVNKEGRSEEKTDVSPHSTQGARR